MTTHTYEVRISIDLEADDPVAAGIAAWVEITRLMADDEFLSIEVRQFVDTDIPPKIYDFDLDNLKAERVWLSPEQVSAWRTWHGIK